MRTRPFLGKINRLACILYNIILLHEITAQKGPALLLSFKGVCIPCKTARTDGCIILLRLSRIELIYCILHTHSIILGQRLGLTKNKNK